MNILYLCDEYPPGPHGGIGTYVRLIARQVVKLGHKVVVAGLYGRGYGGENEFTDEGVKIYRFRWGIDGKWFEDHQSFFVRAANKILLDTGATKRDITKSLAAYKKNLAQIIAHEQIDIVEMPDFNEYIRFCKSFVPFPQLPAPVVVKMHGTLTYFTGEAGGQIVPEVLKMEQTILNQAKAVSSASRYTANKSAGYLSYSKPIRVLYNGIDTNIKLESGQRNPRQVIFTGSLVKKKGIYQLIKAWNLVNKEMPDARLLILGKGPAKKIAAYLSKEAEESVAFKGHVNTKDLYGYLSNSAMAVFPSYAEAFALAPLEAMACGTAVINSNRTSGPELIDDGVNGLLIDPDDVDQLALTILSLLKDPEKSARLAKAGNEKVKAFFDIDIMSKETLKFYEDVLKEKND